jgi:hypothetical protein
VDPTGLGGLVVGGGSRGAVFWWGVGLIAGPGVGCCARFARALLWVAVRLELGRVRWYFPGRAR